MKSREWNQGNEIKRMKSTEWNQGNEIKGKKVRETVGKERKRVERRNIKRCE